MTATRRHLGNGTSANLEQEISAALAADASIGAEELESLIDKVGVGIEAAKQDAVRQRERALDPALSPDINAARQAQDNAAFLVGRLQTLRPRLERKLAAVLDAESRTRWLADYKTVLAKRVEAVELFQNYPDIVVQLLTILHTARNVDAECSRVNLAAPVNEQRRLLGVEQTARAIKSFSAALPSILDSITIPDLEHPGRMLWPEPRLNPALLVAKTADPRASSRWGELKNQEQHAAREQAERDCEQFEHDAEVAQSDGGRIPVWWLKGGNGNAAE